MSLKDTIQTEEKKIYVNENLKDDFRPGDLDYMASLSSAVLQKSPVKPIIILWIGFMVTAWLLVWSSFAEIDEITRGSGKVVPSKQVQIIQNLEGGIVSELLIAKGDIVTTGQILLKIDDTNFASSYKESQLRLQELQAKSFRLEAEANDKPFEIPKELEENFPNLIRQEKSLYLTNKQKVISSADILRQQLKQRQNELYEINAKREQLQLSYSYILKEQRLTRPLLNKGLISEVEYLQLQRQINEMQGELKAAELSIPRVKSTIEESRKKIDEARLELKRSAKEELNEVLAEISRIKESKTALQDRVERTFVRSPVEGTVNQVLINTIGGVIQPGMDLVEIVPLSDNLLIEAKIRPSDIAFLYPGQKTIVKISAYDFGIYGGLQGKVATIGADTITDENGDSFYIVNIKTAKNFLIGKKREKLQIMVGMTTSVDILTGKKTVLEYILKPIIKTKNIALTER